MNLSEWWWVYPRGDKLGLTDRVEPVAVFRHEAVARSFMTERWPSTGEVHQGGIRGPGRDHRVIVPAWTEADEQRMEIVGQNGNEGLHYADLAPTSE